MRSQNQQSNRGAGQESPRGWVESFSGTTRFVTVCLIAAVVVVLAGCPDGALGGSDSVGSSDTTAPVPGGDGIVSILGADSDWVHLSWEPASDNNTISNDIEYRVYVAPDVHTTTPETLAVHGTPVWGWGAGVTQCIVTGLQSRTEYVFVVLARDAGHNVAKYEWVETLTEYPVARVEFRYEQARRADSFPMT